MDRAATSRRSKAAALSLDQLTKGRVAVHIITGAGDAEQRQDGDVLTKVDGYARTDEYLNVMRQA